MNRFKLLLVISVLTGFCAVAYAGFDEGKAAYDKGDYAKAYEEFKNLAEQGNADAQYKLGVMCATGQGVPQDRAEAVKWYRMAAGWGDACAQNNLGTMYKEGLGVPKDCTEAEKLHREAAEQSDDESEGNLQ